MSEVIMEGPIPAVPALASWTPSPYAVTAGRLLCTTQCVIAIPWHPADDVMALLLQADGPRTVSWSVQPIANETALALLESRRRHRRSALVDELHSAIARDEVRLWDVSILITAAQGVHPERPEAAEAALDAWWTRFLERIRPSGWVLRYPSEDQDRALISQWPVGTPTLSLPLRLASHHIRTWFPARRPQTYHPGGLLLGHWEGHWVSAPPVSTVTIVGPRQSGRTSAARWLAVQWLCASDQTGLVLDASGDQAWGLLAHTVGRWEAFEPDRPPLVNLWALCPGIPRAHTIDALAAVCQAVAAYLVDDPIPDTLVPHLYAALRQFYAERGFTDDPATWAAPDHVAWHPVLRPMPTGPEFVQSLDQWPALQPLQDLLQTAFTGPLAPFVATAPLPSEGSEHPYRFTAFAYGSLIAQNPEAAPLIRTVMHYLARVWQVQQESPGWVIVDDPEWTAPLLEVLQTARVLTDRRDPQQWTDTAWCMPGTSSIWLDPGERRALAALGDSFWVTRDWRHPVRLTPPPSLAPLIQGVPPTDA